MSLETWKAEFYPVDACDVSPAGAVAHSLQKWRGLTKENLKKHDLRRSRDWREIRSDDGAAGMLVDTSSCALCKHYIAAHTRDEDGPPYCPKCPLSIVRGDVACDAERSDDDDHDYDDDDYAGPYGVWVETGDAAPMIAALEAAAEYEKNQALITSAAVSLTNKLDWLKEALTGDPAYQNAAGHLCDLLELCRKNIHPSIGPFPDLISMVNNYGQRLEEIDATA